MPKQSREVISIEADALVPDTYGLERFMEEVNILELEGYYFCPSRDEAGKRKDQRKRTLPLSKIAEQPMTIMLSDYGQPEERGYRV